MAILDIVWILKIGATEIEPLGLISKLESPGTKVPLLMHISSSFIASRLLDIF
jgi:hypothetical protein